MMSLSTAILAATERSLRYMAMRREARRRAQNWPLFTRTAEDDLKALAAAQARRDRRNAKRAAIAARAG